MALNFYDFPYLKKMNEIVEDKTDYSKMTDDELLEVLKKSKDFQKLVFPAAWHKKYPDLPKAECSDTKEYIRESPWMRKFEHFYENGGRQHVIEPQPGGLRPVLPAPEVPAVTVVNNSFSDAETNYQTSVSNPPDMLILSVDSTDTTDSKTQE